MRHVNFGFTVVLFGILATHGIFPLWGQTTPENSAQSRVQIINATSVPSISLAINNKLDYPKFPQGLFTADGAVPYVSATYTVVNQNSGAKVEQRIEMDPINHQSLVLMGDFSTDSPPEMLPQKNFPPSETQGRSFPPNIQFLLLPHEESDTPGIRYRVINAMPRVDLQVKSDQQVLSLNPGEIYELSGQKEYVEIPVQAGDNTLNVTMNQQGLLRNGMIIFYLKNGEPAFMRAFENTAKSLAAVEQPEPISTEDNVAPSPD